MNRSLLRTLPLFLLSLVLTMLTPLMTHNETSTKPPFDPITLTPIIQDIRESKRTILLMASLPTRILIIVSAPASSTLTDGLVFSQSPETLHYQDPYNNANLAVHLQTAPQLFTQKWPAMKHLSAGATAVALYDTFQPAIFLNPRESLEEQSSEEYLLIGDTGTLYVLQLNSGIIVNLWKPPSASFKRLFTGAILLSAGDEPMVFYRLLSRGSTHTLKAEKVTFNSSYGRLATLTSFNITQQTETYICETVQSWPDRCQRPANWTVTYGFTNDGAYLYNALAGTYMVTVGGIFENKPNPRVFSGFESGYASFPLADFWALPSKEEPSQDDTEIENQVMINYGIIYLAIGLLFALLGVAFVASLVTCLYFKYGYRGETEEKPVSGKQKSPNNRSK